MTEKTWREAIQSRLLSLRVDELEADQRALVQACAAQVSECLESMALYEINGDPERQASAERTSEHLFAALDDLEAVCSVGRGRFGQVLLDFARHDVFPVVASAASQLGEALIDKAVKKIGG